MKNKLQSIGLDTLSSRLPTELPTIQHSLVKPIPSKPERHLHNEFLHPIDKVQEALEVFNSPFLI